MDKKVPVPPRDTASPTKISKKLSPLEIYHFQILQFSLISGWSKSESCNALLQIRIRINYFLKICKECGVLYLKSTNVTKLQVTWFVYNFLLPCFVQLLNWFRFFSGVVIVLEMFWLFSVSLKKMNYQLIVFIF